MAERDITLSDKIDLTGFEGEMQGESLKALFSRIGFPTALISQYGAICFDVHYGPEITALKQFQPKILIVTEPTWSAMPEMEDPIVLDHKFDIIKALGQDQNLRIAAHSWGSAVRDIKKEQAEFSKVGLITWLKVWPAYISTEEVRSFIENTSDLLVDNGIIVISASSTEKKAQTYFNEVLREGHPGLTMEYILHDYSLAGRFFLICRKEPTIDKVA